MSAPPPPPPPPPMLGGGGPPRPTPSASKSVAPNRSALLADIRGGARLKKAAVINDRSSPLITNKPNNSSPSGGNNSGNGGGGAAPSSATSSAPSPLGLGGLFANGMPKLKATGSRLVEGRTSVTNSSTASNNSPRSVNASSVIRHTNHQSPANHKPASNSSVHNRFATPATASSDSSPDKHASTRNKLESLFNPSANIPSHSAINQTSPSNPSAGGGSSLARLASQRNDSSPSNTTRVNNQTIPVKPAVSQKFHTLKARKSPSSSLQSQAHDTSNMPAHKGQAPLPPGQKPVVQRSNSQTNSRGSALHKTPSRPPSAKPPPPPKQSGLEALATRSFGQGGEASKFSPAPPSAIVASNIIKTTNDGGSTPGSLKPPAPPRNSSFPNNLNNVGRNNQSTSKNLRPPPGPPPPPPNRVSSVTNTNTLPSPSRGCKNFGEPQLSNGSSALHQMSSAGTTSHNKPVISYQDPNAELPPPPPPIRNASIKEFFKNRFIFRDISQIPGPERMENQIKSYPSQLGRSRKATKPPPPPPSVGPPPSHGVSNNNSNLHNKKYHIQINRW